MTIKAIADTHAVIWYLIGNPRLSFATRSVFTQAISEGNQIALSAISFVEIIYLIEKGRIPAETFNRLRTGLERENSILTEIYLTRPIVETMMSIERAKVPDMPDRIISATALHLGVPVISRDGKIRVSGITTVW